MPPTAHQTIEIDGSLALETNVSNHSGDPKSFRVFRDLITDVGHRIVKRDGKGPPLGSIAGTEVQALHEYVFVDPTNGVESYHVLGAIDGGSYIYRWNFISTWVAQTLPITPTPGGRWGFCNAGNAVLAFNGIDQTLIGQQPAIVLLSLTSVATAATATTSVPHQFITGDTVTISGAVQAPYNGAYVVTVTGPTTFTYVFAGSGTSPATGTINASALNVIRWRILGVDAPSFAPTYSLTSHNGAYSVGTVSATQESPTITGTVPAIWPGTPTPTGFTGGVMVINGNAYTISTVAIGGNGTTIAPVLTLTEGFKEVDGTLLPYVIYWGVGSWNDIAPQYRFSYYNPTTGHVSNPSPVLQITETFQQFATITITIPGSAENQAAYLNGYTQIQLYRTPKNAGTMVAMNEKLANVNSAVTTITYVETAAKFADTFLNNFQAPLLNYKPPAGFCSMVFQQGRLFAVHRLSGRVRFTPIGVEVDFGRAIECWPPLYQLEIQAPRAVLEVGGSSSTDSLVVQTSRGDFSLDGYSNITFNPYKLQTRKSGSYLGAAADVDGQLVEFYADNRLMVMRQDVAQRIQDRLSLVKPSLISKVRLHWFAANNTNYLLLSIPKGSSSTANDYTYIFDLDLQGGPIYEWNFGCSAFATVHDPTTLQLQLFMGDSTGAAYRLFGGSHQDAGANFAPTLLTSILRGEENRQELKYVKIWVNDPQVTSGDNTAWTGTLFINEQTDPNAANAEATPLLFRKMDYRYQSAQGRELIADLAMSERAKSKAFQIAITFPNVDAPLWIEGIVIASDMDQLLGVQPGGGGPALGGQQA
jgi:hypothetical protein